MRRLRVDLTPVTVRFTPSASELGSIEAKLSIARPGVSLALAVVFAVGFVVQGVHGIWFRLGGVFHALGVARLILGLCYVPVQMFAQQATRLLCKPDADMDVKIDDFGLTIAQPPLRAPWKDVSGIRDVGEAFIVMRRFGRSIPS